MVPQLDQPKVTILTRMDQCRPEEQWQASPPKVHARSLIALLRTSPSLIRALLTHAAWRSSAISVRSNIVIRQIAEDAAPI